MKPSEQKHRRSSARAHVSSSFVSTTTHCETVQIPDEHIDGPDNTPTNLDVIESICYSIGLDRYLISSFKATQLSNRISSVFTYFGSWTGVFRIYPNRSFPQTCGGYDSQSAPMSCHSAKWTKKSSSRDGQQ